MNSTNFKTKIGKTQLRIASSTGGTGEYGNYPMGRNASNAFE